jgi:catechol-2,3-dioxygenase
MSALGWPSWIGVVCEDLESQRRFYREVLGFRELGASRDWVQFEMGGGRLVELVRRRADPQYDRARYQVGYVVDDIEAWRTRLVNAGVSALTPILGEPATDERWCYFRDLEGNVFEIKERKSRRSRDAP